MKRLHAEPTGPTSKPCETQPKATNDVFLLKKSRTERRKFCLSQPQTEGKFKNLTSSVILPDKYLNKHDIYAK